MPDLPTALVARLSVAGPHDASVQPSVPRSRLAQGPDSSPRGDQRLLDCVLRTVLVAKDQRGHRIETADRGRGGFREGGGIAVPGLLDQFLLHAPFNAPDVPRHRCNGETS